MKFLVVVSCLLAAACAKPSAVVSPIAYSNIAPSSFGYSYSSHVSAPAVAYSAQTVAAPAVAYSAPVAYSAHSVAPAVAYSAHSVAAPAVTYSTQSAVHSTVVGPSVRSAVVAPAVHTTYAAPAVHTAYAAPAVHTAYAAPAVHTAYATPAVHTTYAAPAVRSAVITPAVVGVEKTQYHAQDDLGQAAYGHSEAFQTHNAIQDAHGNKIGSYSYVAPDGQVVATNYVADALGYRVASNAAPVESAEVVAARAAHLAEYDVVKHRSRRSAGVFAAYASPLAYQTPVTTYGASPYYARTAYSGHIVAQPHAYAYRYY